MANLTKQQVSDIIKNAPPGSNPRDIVEGLVKRGHTLEGFSTTATTTAVQPEAPQAEVPQPEQKPTQDFSTMQSRVPEAQTEKSPLFQFIGNVEGEMSNDDKILSTVNEKVAQNIGIKDEGVKKAMLGNLKEKYYALQTPEEKKKYLQDMGMTYEEAGQKLGLSPEQTSNILAPEKKIETEAVKQIVGGTTKSVGGLGKMLSSVVMTPYYALTGEQQKAKKESHKGMSGLMDITGGALQTYFSPVTGTIESAPSFIKEPVKWIGNKPNEFIDMSAKFLGKLRGYTDEEINSPEYQENVVRPLQEALQLGMVLKGATGKGTLGNIKEMIKPKNVMQEAVKKGTEIVQPSVRSLESAIAKGTTESGVSGLIDMVKQGYQKGVKTFEELYGRAKEYGKELKGKRDAIIDKVGGILLTKTRILEPLLNEIKKWEADPQFADNPAVAKLRGMLEKEAKAMKGKSISLKEAELRKEALYKEADKIYHGKYNPNPIPGADTFYQGLDYLAKGLKKEIERAADGLSDAGLGQQIKKLNEKLGNNIELRDSLKTQTAKAMKSVTQEGGNIAKIVQAVKNRDIGGVIQSGAKSVEQMLPAKLKSMTKSLETVERPIATTMKALGIRAPFITAEKKVEPATKQQELQKTIIKNAGLEKFMGKKSGGLEQYKK